jgi:hypothetical protein
MNATHIDIDGPSYRQHIARQRSRGVSVDLDNLDS